LARERIRAEGVSKVLKVQGRVRMNVLRSVAKTIGIMLAAMVVIGLTLSIYQKIFAPARTPFEIRAAPANPRRDLEQAKRETRSACLQAWIKDATIRCSSLSEVGK
jgi:hypothetical protein